MANIECGCGRTIKGLGWAAHAAACPVEQAGSAAFVAACDRGEPGRAWADRLAAEAAARKSAA